MVRWKGEGADRCRWQMQGGGRSKNNEQTRLRPSCRSMRRLFFRAEPDGFESRGNICIKTKKQITEVTCFMVRWKGLEPLTP